MERTRTNPSAQQDRQSLLGVIDSHCHMWQREQVLESLAEFKPLLYTFGPSELEAASRGIGLQSCILIESGTTAQDNQRMAELAASSALIGAFVSYVELEDSALESKLDTWQGHPKFRGVRARYEGHPDSHVLARPAVVQGLRKIAERGLVFEFLVRARHLQDILKLYEQIPDLRAVIEHMAKPDIANGTDSAEWYSGMEKLEKQTSVKCKLSLSPRVEEMTQLRADGPQGWNMERLKPFVLFLVESFGCERLMWGSDWPVVLLASDYQGAYQTMRSALGALSTTDEVRIFQDTARQFYGPERL